MRPVCCRPRVLLALALLVGGAPVARAQAPGWDPLSRTASRESLQGLLNRLQAAAESPAYSPVLRAQARAEADKIRNRLAAGDFLTGDRILLIVEGEQALSDTFSVTPGPELVLPTAGTMSLAGVLRSELEGRLSEHVQRYVRNPKIRAQTLVRLMLDGQVSKPGFYTLSTDLILTDALDLAGGLSREADLEKVAVERQNTVLWDAAALQRAIADGRTLDQLGVRAGDRIYVGGKPTSLGGFESSARTLLLLLTVPAAVTSLIAIFR